MSLAKKPKLDFKALKNDLIKKYQKYYVKTDFIPWKPEEDEVDIDDVYSPLYMDRKLKKSRKTRAEKISQTKHGVKTPEQKEDKNAEKQPMSSIYELFSYNNRCFKKILISAESGAGKTTLCRKLISLWCKQSENRSETEASSSADPLKEFIYVSGENQTVDVGKTESLKFEFLFYVSLRHARQDEYIEDMIVKQLKIKEEDLQQILDSKNCVVIVDGLDEWTPQQHTVYGPMDIKGCPKERHADRFYTVFTTRPWKLVDEARDADKLELQFQLKGVHSNEQMITSYAHFMKMKTEFSPEHFLESMGKKSHLMSTPLLVKLLMLLWAESGKLEESECRLYGRVVELLIRSGLERNDNDEEFKKIAKGVLGCSKHVPDCFKDKSEFSNLRKYLFSVQQVAKVSFETLLKGTEFLSDTDEMYAGIHDADSNFLKKLGLFSQRPHIGGSLLCRESEVTFIHKSFQEFYAAMHIVSNPEECYKTLKARWYKQGTESTNARAVVLSDVFKFVSGMDPNAMPKMYELIFMYSFEDLINLEKQTELSGDTSEKLRTLVRKRYGCFVNENIFCNTCSLGEDEEGSLFHKHISRNVTEILSCGHSDFRIHITDLCLIFHEANGETVDIQMLNMLLYLKYVDHSSLETLLIQYGNTCIFFSAFFPDEMHSESVCLPTTLENIFDTRLHLCSNLWSGECSNLKEVKLKKVSLTYGELEKVLMTRPSKLEIIILDDVGCCSHGNSSEFGSDAHRNAGMKDKEFGKGFSEDKLSTTFNKLKELRLVGICVLTHSQITHMLADSPSLQTVLLHDVQCKKDRLCGCNEPDNVEKKENTSFEITSTASSVKQLSIENSVGILCHINPYPQLEKFTLKNSKTEKPDLLSQIHLLCSVPSDATGLKSFNRLRALRVINLDCLEIDHTHMTCILMSPQLEIAVLSDIVCRADSMCGCLAESGTSGTIYAECTLQELTVSGGKEIFTHVSKMMKLRKLCFKGTVEGIDRVFLTDCNLKEVVFKEIDFEDSIHFDPDCSWFDRCFEISQHLLLKFLFKVSENNGILVRLEKVYLPNGDADYVHETVSRNKNIEVLKFTKFVWEGPRVYEFEIEPGWIEEDISDPVLVKTSSKSNILSMTIQTKPSCCEGTDGTG